MITYAYRAPFHEKLNKNDLRNTQYSGLVYPYAYFSFHILLMYRPFHKTLPRSMCICEMDLGKVLWNGLYNNSLTKDNYKKVNELSNYHCFENSSLYFVWYKTCNYTFIMSKKIMEYLSKINTKIISFFTITYKYAEGYKEYTCILFTILLLFS